MNKDAIDSQWVEAVDPLTGKSHRISARGGELHWVLTEPYFRRAWIIEGPELIPDSVRLNPDAEFHDGRHALVARLKVIAPASKTAPWKHRKLVPQSGSPVARLCWVTLDDLQAVANNLIMQDLVKYFGRLQSSQHAA